MRYTKKEHCTLSDEIMWQYSFCFSIFALVYQL